MVMPTCESACDKDARLCQSRLAGHQYLELVTIALFALGSAFLLGGRLTLLRGLFGRLVREDANAAEQEDVDGERMMRGGTCLNNSPYHAMKCIRGACAACCTFLGEVFQQNRSMLTLFFVALVAFLVGFFQLHAEPHPCVTALGGCSTISCVCANYYFQGYVFMFVLLTLVSLELIKEVNKGFPLENYGDMRGAIKPKHASFQQHFTRAQYTFALMLITLTGVFPAISTDSDNRDEGDGMGDISNELHTFGVLAACGTLVLGQLVRAMIFCDWSCRQTIPWPADDALLQDEAADNLQDVRTTLQALIRSSPRAAKVHKYVYRFAWFGFATFFAYYSGTSTLFTTAHHKKYASLATDTSNFCLGIGSRAECEVWPQNDVRMSSNSTCWDNIKIPQPLYTCAWLEGDLYNRDATPADDATAPVVSSYCDKVKCPLFERSRAMVLEFAVLFLALAYFQTWGLQEVGEVLVKKTKSAMMAAPEQEDGGSPYVPLSAGVQHEPPLGLPLG